MCDVEVHDEVDRPPDVHKERASEIGYVTGYVMSCLTRYMRRPINLPLTPGEFESWVDSSWADVKPSRKSTSHYILCNNALVHRRSKVASILTTSTTEAAVISAARCSQDVVFCRKLANELGFTETKPTVLWEDNNGCLSLARTGHYRGRSKHFALRFQFISDYIDCVF